MAANVKRKVPTRGLTSAEIRDLVEEARADVDVCLISPMWGAMNPGDTWRHLERFVKVMGLATRGAAYSKIVGTALGVPVGLFVLMHFNSNFGWVGDLVWSALLGVLIAVMGTGYFAYKAAFCRIVVDEHRDYVDPDQVTAQVNAWTDRLAHYYSRAWRGDNEANGIANPHSALYYQTCDRTRWLEEGEEVQLSGGGVAKGPQLVLYPARKIEKFTEMKDYIGLTPQVFDVGGNPGRDRRAGRRMFSKPGAGMLDFELRRRGFISNNIAWFYSGGCIILAAFIVMLVAG